MNVCPNHSATSQNTPVRVARVDGADRKVYVDLTKDQIKDSPELGETTTYDDPEYRNRLGTYYGGFYS